VSESSHIDGCILTGTWLGNEVALWRILRGWEDSCISIFSVYLESLSSVTTQCNHQLSPILPQSDNWFAMTAVNPTVATASSCENGASNLQQKPLSASLNAELVKNPVNYGVLLPQSNLT
jgi:hypothetical protein